MRFAPPRNLALTLPEKTRQQSLVVDESVPDRCNFGNFTIESANLA